MRRLEHDAVIGFRANIMLYLFDSGADPDFGPTAGLAKFTGSRSAPCCLMQRRRFYGPVSD